MMYLSQAPTGSIVEVVAIRGGMGVMRRLSALSIRIGDRLKVINNPHFGPVLVEHLTHGHRVAIGRGIALKVEVRMV